MPIDTPDILGFGVSVAGNKIRHAALMQWGPPTRGPWGAEGYLINPYRYERSVPPWSDVVTAIKAAYLHHLREKVHSLYLRGSVAKGMAIAGVSDIDTFAVIFGERETIDRSWIAAFQQRMAVQYPFQTGIEIDFVPYRVVCDAHGARGSRLMIKTQCVCLWGGRFSPVPPPV